MRRIAIGLLLAFGPSGLDAQTADTAEILTLVVEGLTRQRERSDSLRATYCAARQSACPPRSPMPPETWYVEENLGLATMLAERLGVSAKHAGVGTMPKCAWTQGVVANLQGYATKLVLSIVADSSATVTLTRRCDNPSRRMGGEYWSEYTFSLRRDRGRWIIETMRIGVT